MKTKYVVLLCACLIVAIVCAVLNFTYQRSNTDTGENLEDKLDSIKNAATDQMASDSTETVTDTVQATDASQGTTESDETSSSEESSSDTSAETVDSSEVTTQSQQTSYVPPSDTHGVMDFTWLKRINPEIYAWIEIEGTRIDYPVLQSADNDKKYLSTAYDGSPYVGGAIFTEKTYNSSDFNDPVTVIYGHTMRSGNIFGQLQKTYSTKDSFDMHSQIKMYLPGETRTYTVFAAVPYDRIHIMHTYDFSKEYWYNRFFKDVKNIREIGAIINQDITPQYDDRVIILSVCLNEDATRRFLVMAVFDKDLADNQ